MARKAVRFETTTGVVAIPECSSVIVVALTEGVRPVIRDGEARFYDAEGAPVLTVSGWVTAE